MTDVPIDLIEFADTTPGIHKKTVQTLQAFNIMNTSQLKEKGWKGVMSQIPYVGPEKLSAIFNALDEPVSVDEIKEYRDKLTKINTPPISRISPSFTQISPTKLTVSEMEEIARKTPEEVKNPLPKLATALESGEAIIRTVDGRTVKVHKIQTIEEQKFKKFTLTRDMENLINDIIGKSDDELISFSDEVTNTILNASDEFSPTGARSHVKQWINLLERKIEGKKTIDIQRFREPSQFREALKPLIKEIVEGMMKEVRNGNLASAMLAIENARTTNTRPDFTLDNIMHTIILYKIYVDAKGAGWDGNPDNGQLGTMDKEIFFDRMKKKSKEFDINSKDEKGYPTAGAIAVKRCWSAYQSGIAVLLAGLPGSGKTYFSKATGNAMTDNVWEGLPYSRVNVTRGLEPSDLMGEWDYQAQILAISASKKQLDANSLSVDDIEYLRENIFTIDYFRFGSLSLCMIQGCPILIDEVNRGSEDIQNTLLQAIDEYEIVIPEIGRIKATPGFFVMCTINDQDVGTTELGGAFLRRVIRIAFDEPSDYIGRVVDEYPAFDKQLLKQLVAVIREIKKRTTISSEISPVAISVWSRELINIYGPKLVLDKEKILLTLGTILKNKADIEEINKDIDNIISSAGVLK